MSGDMKESVEIHPSACGGHSGRLASIPAIHPALRRQYRSRSTKPFLFLTRQRFGMGSCFWRVLAATLSSALGSCSSSARPQAEGRDGFCEPRPFGKGSGRPTSPGARCRKRSDHFWSWAGRPRTAQGRGEEALNSIGRRLSAYSTVRDGQLGGFRRVLRGIRLPSRFRFSLVLRARGGASRLGFRFSTILASLGPWRSLILYWISSRKAMQIAFGAQARFIFSSVRWGLLLEIHARIQKLASEILVFERPRCFGARSRCVAFRVRTRRRQRRPLAEAPDEAWSRHCGKPSKSPRRGASEGLPSS
jgi:hypothetical protein